MQLQLSDVKYENKIAYFDLLDNDNEKQLKTDNARRRIPMHTELLKLGILEYVEQMTALGLTRFLETFPLTENKPSKSLTRWFGETYIKSHIQAPWKSENKVLYSFRHTFITKAINLDVELGLQQIVGHEPSHMGSTKSYYQGAELAQLQQAINSVTFGNIGLDKLEGGWEPLIEKIET